MIWRDLLLPIPTDPKLKVDVSSPPPPGPPRVLRLFQQQRKAFSNVPLWGGWVSEQVGQLQVPLLLIVGEDDQNWPSQESALDVSWRPDAEAADHLWYRWRGRGSQVGFSFSFSSLIQMKEMMERAGNSHLLTILSYPDAGHLIEPPYTPHFRFTVFKTVMAQQKSKSRRWAVAECGWRLRLVLSPLQLWLCGAGRRQPTLRPRRTPGPRCWTSSGRTCTPTRPRSATCSHGNGQVVTRDAPTEDFHPARNRQRREERGASQEICLFQSVECETDPDPDP